MVRFLIAAAVLSCALAGCASQPKPPLTAAQQKVRDQEARLLLARLIANSLGFGATSILYGNREYHNARVSGIEKDRTRICAKFFVKNYNILGDREVGVTGTVIEGPNGMRVSLPRYNASFIGAQCEGPYVPFPELEAYAPPKPA